MNVTNTLINESIAVILNISKGNVVQAVIFALPHFVIRGSASIEDIFVRIINAFLLGYTFGWPFGFISDYWNCSNEESSVYCG